MKHVFFDFDGVINVFSPISKEFYNNASGKVKLEKTNFAQYPIQYNPEVIDFINSLVDNPQYKVYWLTSWCKKTKWFKNIGLSENIEIIMPLRYINPNKGYIWKNPAGIEKAKEILNKNPLDIIYWVDDDKEINTKNISHPQVKPINTEEHTGITKEVMKIINAEHNV